MKIIKTIIVSLVLFCLLACFNTSLHKSHAEIKNGSTKAIANIGMIDKALVDQWLSLVEETDFTELVTRLGTGECRACFDGIDYVYNILPESKNIQLSSRDYGFSTSEKFFSASEQLLLAMSKTAPLAIESR